MLFCCLWRNVDLVINISSSSPAIDKLCRLLSAISVTTCGTVVRRRRVDNTWPVAALTARTDIDSESWFLPTRSAFHAPVRGYSSEYCHDVWYGKKLEWCGYPMVKKFWRYVSSLWQKPWTWQTHEHTDTAWRLRPRLHIIARHKLIVDPHEFKSGSTLKFNHF